MKNLIKFGEDVQGYEIPVLNEREIRASAGILFVWMFIALMLILFKGNFLLIKYVIIIFLTDMLIRVFVNPRFSPTLIVGRLIVSRQEPEYVGAAQKKFAWKIGIALSGLMFLLLVIINSYSLFTGLSCLVCLVFLFFESAFGICIGCVFYNLFYKKKARYCTGKTCDPVKKQEVQKTSWIQILILIGLIGYVLLMIFLFNEQFSKNPSELAALLNSEQAK